MDINRRGQNISISRTPSIVYIAGFYIGLWSMCRMIGVISPNLSLLLACALLVLSFFMLHHSRLSVVVCQIDLFWLLSLLLVIVNADISYGYLQRVAFCIGWLCMFVFRVDKRALKFFLLGIFLFSCLNIASNFIALSDYNAYTTFLDLLGADRGYYHPGYLYGLGKDTGRNAVYCIIGASVTISYLFVKNGLKKIKLFCWIYSLVACAIVLSTGKLGPSLFMLLSIIIVSGIAENRLSKKLARSLTVVAVLIVSVVLAYKFFPSIANIVERTLQKNADGNVGSGRLTIWKSAFELFLKRPLFGIGYGGFASQSTSYFNDGFVGVHNDYLQWLCEWGLVGFIINLIATVGTYWFSIKIMKQVLHSESDSLSKLLAVWSVFFQSFIILYSLTGIPHYSYETLITYFAACAVPFCLLKTETNLLYSTSVGMSKIRF